MHNKIIWCASLRFIHLFFLNETLWKNIIYEILWMTLFRWSLKMTKSKKNNAIAKCLFFTTNNIYYYYLPVLMWDYHKFHTPKRLIHFRTSQIVCAQINFFVRILDNNAQKRRYFQCLRHFEWRNTEFNERNIYDLWHSSGLIKSIRQNNVLQYSVYMVINWMWLSWHFPLLLLLLFRTSSLVFSTIFAMHSAASYAVQWYQVGPSQRV